jgi:hypothetical protein
MEKESLNLTMSKIIILELFPKIIQELNNLNLKEHIVPQGVYYNQQIKSIKFTDDGIVFIQETRANNVKEYVSFYDINRKKDCEIFGNSIQVLRAFILKLTYELAILKMMRKEIEESIKNVKGDINLDISYRVLITEI